ncbi:MAG: 2-oxoglutarate dehydrogenase E1 component [Polyangiaceae bacterium]|jgi:2-oxoglutarate dehydrogenase E1 component
MFEEFGINAGYVEDQFARWLESPNAVEERWQRFFERLSDFGVPSEREPAELLGREPRVADASRPRVNVIAPALPPTGPGVGMSMGSGWAPPPSNLAHGNGTAAQVASLHDHPLVRDTVLAATELQSRVAQLVNAYRVRGHLFANVDPLGTTPEVHPELELANFGLTKNDLDKSFSTAGLSGLPSRATLQQIIEHLGETYCSSIGVEFTYIGEPEQRLWLQERMETTRNHASLDHAEFVRILTKLTEAEIFEQFIHKNYVGARRFSAEGAESMIPMIDLLIEVAGQHGIEELVIGMAHRGRLNVLVNVMGKNVREVFAAFDDSRPERFLGSGDVKYHLGYSSDVVTTSGHALHLSMAFNPSHLEFVNPVVEGRVRAKLDRSRRKGTMPLLIHGDAAFMGQGVVTETLNLAGLEGYSTGGTVHLVINNQIGFTTLPHDSRSTRYCTDIVRMLRVPVFHVNGEDPEAVIQVTRLAINYRQRFKQDVVIDMYCYRRRGHNEGDEPRFTQPLMYSLIDEKPTVREAYVARLVAAGHVTRAEADAIAQERKANLERALTEAHEGDFLQMPETMGGVWAPYRGGPDSATPEVDTRFPKERLLGALRELTVTPDWFRPNQKALRIIEQRRDRALNGQPLDWGTAEHLAFASLLLEGHGIRVSGQDVRRGTFSHRHATLFDIETGEPFTPLSHLGERLGSVASGGVGRFEIFDSPLSEAGVLGFEYGYSLDRPDKLVIWEAQFGDFVNGAQVIVDQFIVSAEDKWSRLSGLVVLLPHGFEGQGPEHSSGRMERFLHHAAEDNIQVCNLTTPSQFFHVLRRQVKRPWRKPLIIFTPKSLLRNPEAVSTMDELAGGAFQRVIGDRSVAPSAVKRILVCTGKVYYDLVAERRRRGQSDLAIVRLEQIYPFSPMLAAELDRYPEGTPVVWVQEEPRNMGAWYFVRARSSELFGEYRQPSIVSRPESSSPATGSKSAHDLEQKRLLDEACT